MRYLSHCPDESRAGGRQGSGLPIIEIYLFHINFFEIIFCRTSDACELVAAWLTAACCPCSLPRLGGYWAVVVARGRAAVLQRDLALFSVELTALGRAGEAGLGSAQALRALTHGRRRLQPLPAASGSTPGLLYGPALAQSLSWAGNGSMTGPWQCLLTLPWLGSRGQHCQCPRLIQAGLAALVTGTMLLVLYRLKSGSRDQPAELVLNLVLRMALHPCSLETHVAFPTQLALVLWRGTEWAGVQQLL